MNANQTPDPVQKLLDAELDKIDVKTQDHLRAIRRAAINSANADAEKIVENYSASGQISLLLHPLWRQKKWLLAAMLALCLAVVLMNRVDRPVSPDIYAEFSLYSEVDPEWLMDMEIAEVFGDD